MTFSSTEVGQGSFFWRNAILGAVLAATASFLFLGVAIAYPREVADLLPK
jgi:hypothetical protein